MCENEITSVLNEDILKQGRKRFYSDWSDNNPIQIRIEDEVMYISNSSLLPPDFTVETMMHSHRSMPLNPEIADVFYRAGYIVQTTCLPAY